jgi:SAM-dependent methyltransferase
MVDYWNQRYLREGKIWGDKPSKTAQYALKLFLDRNISKILIPGSGTGRNTNFFSLNGFDVTGIEISKEALNIAKKIDLKTLYFHGSILNLQIEDNFYDAVYCFNVLHLFLFRERKKFIDKIYKSLKSGGYMFFTVFSTGESSYGNGKKLEENTYESKPGRPTHYYDENDLNEQFKKFSVIENGITLEKENHGERGPHVHHLRYIFARKY